MDLQQRSVLFAAGDTPRAPHVQYVGLALKRLRADRGPGAREIRQAELWRRFADERGLQDALAARCTDDADEEQRGQRGESERRQNETALHQPALLSATR